VCHESSILLLILLYYSLTIGQDSVVEGFAAVRGIERLLYFGRKGGSLPFQASAILPLAEHALASPQMLPSVIECLDRIFCCGRSCW